ncbi:MAG: hypothetical protein FJW56_00345 [Actinobacteria bacterium]|nr:hypothetical protein [Actinomycetota bacterium]
MKFTDDEKKVYREAKKQKIIALRKMLSQMSDDQRQALAEKFGIVTVEGHPLTPYNQCFLVAQAPINFTIIGGFQQWRKSGRMVKKGEHGFLILVPSVPAKVQDVDNYILSNDDDDIKFFAGTVFDITQTEPLNKELQS